MNGNAELNRTGMVDSLSANEFAVEIDGARADGIFKISGLIPFKRDISHSPIKVIYESFQISKMVQRDPNLPFNVWLRETFNGTNEINPPKRDVAILALDEGVEIRRWTVKGAWISEVSYSDFDSGSGELVQETVTINYEKVDVSWFEG